MSVEVRDPSGTSNYFEQKKQLPILKKNLIFIRSTKELVDLSQVHSTVLQDVCDRVNKAFERYIKGDCNGKPSGKPRLKNQARYRTLTFDGANSSWMKFCTINGKWLYLRLLGVG